MDNAASLLIESATRLFADHTSPHALIAAEDGTWPEAAWAAVEAAGFPLALVPEAAGGFGMPLTDALQVVRIAGETALPLPLPEAMLGNWLLARAGLPLGTGPLTIAPVTAESGLDLCRSGAGWTLNGVALRVPWGRAARLAAVIECDGAAFVALVPAGATRVTPGINVAREPRDTLNLAIDLPSSAVAPLGAGSGCAGLRAAGAAMRCLQMAGALAHITEMTVRYAQERVQFGRPIGKFQAIQQSIAVLTSQAAAARAAADLAAEAMANDLCIPAIASAKTRIGEAAGIAAAIAHQIHGAMGFTYEHSLHLFTKRLWSWRDEFGREAEWSRLLGRHLAEAGADRLWAELTAI